MQGLVIRNTLCLPIRQTFTQCHIGECRRRGLRPVCSADPALAEAPPKRKPGRPKKTQKAQPNPDPAAATETLVAQPKETTSRKKKTKELDSDDDEETSFQSAFPGPWEQLSEEQIAQQIREVEALEAVRAEVNQSQAVQDKRRARESVRNEFIYRDPAYLELERTLLDHTKSGWQPKRGYYGRGKPQWWALNVHSAKRMKKVADFMSLEVEGLPPLESEPDGRRLFETWLPSKVIKAYSLRTEKMGTKTVKFGHGMIMLVKAIMDEELFELISSNIYVGSFGDSEVITDRDGILHTVPKPCTAEYIAEIETWVKTKEVRSKEEVMLAEFGYADERAIYDSNRMDTNADYVEIYDDEEAVDDMSVPQPTQRRRYKDDAYRGSYNNPSNWYRGTSDAEPGAGQRSGAGQESRVGTGARAGQDNRREARAGQGNRGDARAGQDSRGEARVGQTARAEARQEARMDSAQARRAATSFKTWDTGRATSSGPSGPRDSQSRDRRFNPKDWQGSSAEPAPSAGQPPSRPQAGAPAGSPAGSPASTPALASRTASWWLGGNQPDSAGVAGLNDEASMEEWEPTGAGRKGWYNPQASPSSETSSAEGTRAGRMGDRDPSQQSPMEDWRKKRPAASTTRHPSALYGNDKEAHTADWSRPQSQSQGYTDRVPATASANYDAQLQKPVLQGRAKEIKKLPRGPMRMKQLRNRGLNQDADFVGKRGAVGKSSGYSPIQKFDTVKLIGNKPTNWTRDEDALPDADEAFEMPSFEHLEGEQWTDSSLQFNNVSNAASGSHLDQWKKENSDWRSDAQTQAQRSQSRGDSVPPLPQPPSSSSVSAPSLPGNPVPEDGVTDEWGRTPGVAFTNPTALQQPAAASSGVPTNPKSPEKLQATPSNAVSWDTGGFDFADMKTDAGNDSEAGGGRNSRVQSRADTRRPSRERKQGRSQESPRGAGATRQVDASDGSNDQRAGAPVDTDQEPADDFESFWNQF